MVVDGNARFPHLRHFEVMVNTSIIGHTLGIALHDSLHLAHVSLDGTSKLRHRSGVLGNVGCLDHTRLARHVGEEHQGQTACKETRTATELQGLVA